MNSMERFRVEAPEQGLPFMFADVTVSMINVVGTAGDKRVIDIWYLENRLLGQDLKPKIPYMIVFDNKSFPFNYSVIASAPIYNDLVVHLVKYVGP